jgi:hypothetical protein
VPSRVPLGGSSLLRSIVAISTTVSSFPAPVARLQPPPRVPSPEGCWHATTRLSILARRGSHPSHISRPVFSDVFASLECKTLLADNLIKRSGMLVSAPRAGEPMLRRTAVSSHWTGNPTLQWAASDHIRLTAVGQNLFQPHHVKFVYDPGPPVGIRRSFYGQRLGEDRSRSVADFIGVTALGSRRTHF